MEIQERSSCKWALRALHVGAGQFCSGSVGLCNPDKASGQKKYRPGGRILNCAECIEFFCTCHKYSAANSNGYKTNVYDFVISKTLVLSFEFSSIRNFARAAIFFIVAADKVSWKQNHTSELINADLKVPVRGWFAGQEFKCSALPAAVCSLPKHQVHLLCHGAGAATRTGWEVPISKLSVLSLPTQLLGAGWHQGNGPELEAEIAVFCLSVELVLKAACHGWGMWLVGMLGADRWPGWAQWSFPVLMIVWQKAVSPLSVGQRSLQQGPHLLLKVFGD